MVPSWTWSSTPVTVTVWATFQLAVLNVRLAVETVPSAGLLLATGTATLAAGWLVRAARGRGVGGPTSRFAVGTVAPGVEPVPCAGLVLANGIATLAVGWLLRRT